jgi:hypothetical protein
MTFWIRLTIYAGTVLLYVMTAAWIVRAWTRKRYRDKSPSDLHYIAVGIVLVVSAGLGVLVASQIVVVLGYTRDRPNAEHESASIVQHLLVVRSSHEDLPHLQRGLALVEAVGRKHLTDDPPGKDRRCPICLG